MSATTDKGSGRGLEIRSIDYVPLNERHGKVSHIGPLWFVSNAQIATLAVGLISITTGGNLIWSLLAIAIGVLVGTLFMAAHSSQGPQLGLPQMIQSRPQFGYIGALLVWLFAYLQYAGFNIFNTILAGQAISESVNFGSQNLWFWVVTIVAVVIALFGYDLIHAFERYLTYLTIIMLALLTIAAVKLAIPAGAYNLADFHMVPFLGQLGVAAGYQISWAIYVSDYSRYLPPASGRGTFRWTFWGSALGGIWVMFLGAYIGAAAGENFETIGSIKSTADQLFGGFGGIALFVAALGLLSVTALNMYGGSLTLISSIDSVRQIRPTLRLRIITISVTALISVVLANLASADFLANFNDFLLLVLYFFIPWTAVNLTDYFIVRKGHYAIAEIFKPDGIYGRWGWPGIISYLVGFVVMIPFFSAGKLFVGFIAHALDGADISLFIGLPVSAGLYWLMTRRIDVEGETRMAKEEADALEAAAHEHLLP
ncbi:purine-cytosine permease family protein [Arthrobacter bambusae]|uniref:Purine-cytosine permease-like protein n=1 Tax=Arthrobacter bambusae TaxID=1338426 RepID=A0AAW8DFD7_9MICC|nr:cytosine permease [Arthrobacter bambusae]MDP9907147.1 purine-cytosine permease-like protein [Arthrobacter bambusae]MDQ0131366.1 purine-cytosine permease-like protein [Arthrobacter bambusae]MDQ0182699.1 purine-cytosine permease-like protein [Arthrobacter bambusae]